MPDVLRLLFDQVVIKELEPERMRKSGLLVPQGTHDMPPNEGIVLAVGDGPPDLPDFKMPLIPGDHVVFPRSAGVWVEIEDERLLAAVEDDVDLVVLVLRVAVVVARLLAPEVGEPQHAQRTTGDRVALARLLQQD